MSDPKFQIGDRVIMTNEARQTFKKITSDTGVVVGFCADGRIVVQRGGIKKPSSWGAHFWQVDIVGTTLALVRLHEPETLQKE